MQSNCYAFLRSCFPDLDGQTVKSALDKCNNNAEQAAALLETINNAEGRPVDVSFTESDLGLLERLDIEQTTRHSEEYDYNLSVLAEEFPSFSLDTIQAALIANEHDLSGSRRSLLGLEDEKRAESSYSKKASLQRSQRKNMINVTSHKRSFSAASSSSTSTTTTSSSKQRVIDTSTDMTSVWNSSIGHSKETGDKWRMEASKYAQERSRMYERASKEFRKAQHGPAIAGYYAERGRELADRMVECNWNAAEAYVAANNTSTGTGEYVLDLHHLHVKEALVVLEEQMQSWKRTGVRQATIITGRGKQTKQLTGKLFGAVEKYLLRNNFKFDYGVGSFLISLSQSK